jgi:HSP20 family molecular chaperone IbpA
MSRAGGETAEQLERRALRMTRTSWFDSPFLVGFEQLRDLAERAANGEADGYPPYNIENRGDGLLRVTLAVAGFAPEELGAELHDRQLVLTGEKANGSEERSFLHRGIAARRFRRAFVLGDGYEVEGATLENGLLHIDVKRRERAPDVKRIAIQSIGA